MVLPSAYCPRPISESLAMPRIPRVLLVVMAAVAITVGSVAVASGIGRQEVFTPGTG